MNTINLGSKGDSSLVYELMSILDIKGCDGKIIYEIHDQSTSGQNEPNPEFVNRSKPFYKAFVNYRVVDQCACDYINYAAKIDNVLYFLYDTGANTYLGTGPTSTLGIREYCFKKGLKILYIEGVFTEWIAGLLDHSDIEKREEKKSDNKKNDIDLINPITTISEPYHEVNEIIYHCGEGISKIIQTAAKLNEENYRDLFLAAINSHFPKFIAIAEGSNRDGRTDLKIYDKRRTDVSEYIYEFKVYGKKANIINGLAKITDQYVTPQNKYNGLVIINNNKCDLSKLMSRILKYINEMNIIITQIIPYPDEYRFVVNHKHKRDETCNCKLTIHIFDIQQSIKS